LLFLFEERQIFAVTFFLQFLDRNETERGRIDAVAHPAFITWTVIEEVAEMRFALAAADLRAFHSKRAVRFFGDVTFIDRFGEAGPAAAAVEFVQGSKQRLATDNIDIDPGTMI